MTPKLLKSIRVGAACLALGMVCSVGYYFYRSRLTPGTSAHPLPRLGKDIASDTRKIEYVEHRSGKPSLRVLAARNTADLSGLNRLQTVRAIRYRGQAGQEDVIDAGESLYSITENHIQFREGVTVRLYPGYTLQTRTIDYDKATETVTSRDPFRISSDKGLRGEGTGFTLHLDRRELVLDSPMHLTSPAGAITPNPRLVQEGELRMQADSALLRDLESTIRLKGHVRLEGSLTRIVSDEMLVELTSQRAFRRVTCTGQASVERQETGRRLSMRGSTVTFQTKEGTQLLESLCARGSATLTHGSGRLLADQVDILGDDQGGASRLVARGGAHVDSTAGDQTLAGNTITADLTPDGGKLRTVVAEGSASLDRRAQKARSRVDAGRISCLFRPDSTGSLLESADAQQSVHLRHQAESGGESTCQADTMHVLYDASGRLPRQAEGNGSCSLRFLRRTPSEDTRVDAPRIRVDFHPNTSEPRNFWGEGGVDLHRTLRGQSSSSRSQTLAGTLSLPTPSRREPVSRLEKMSQRGGVTYNDDRANLQAEQSDYQDGLLTLTGSPRVQSPESVTRASRITYDPATGTANAIGDVETIYRSTRGQAGLLPGGAPRKGGEPITTYLRADSARLEEKGARITYAGRCRILQDPNLIMAQNVTWNRAGQTIKADGDVSLSLLHAENGQNRRIDIHSRHLDYDAAGRKFALEGQVKTKSADMNVSSDQASGRFDESGGIRTFLARGSVRIDQAGRTATGDVASVDQTRNILVIQGSPARITDNTRRSTTEGRQLTYVRGEDRVIVETTITPLTP